jgi:hypothetical protein
MGLDGDAVDKGLRWAKSAFIRAAVITFIAAMALGIVVGQVIRHLHWS